MWFSISEWGGRSQESLVFTIGSHLLIIYVLVQIYMYWPFYSNTVYVKTLNALFSVEIRVRIDAYHLLLIIQSDWTASRVYLRMELQNRSYVRFGKTTTPACSKAVHICAEHMSKFCSPFSFNDEISIWVKLSRAGRSTTNKKIPLAEQMTRYSIIGHSF